MTNVISVPREFTVMETNFNYFFLKLPSFLVSLLPRNTILRTFMTHATVTAENLRVFKNVFPYHLCECTAIPSLLN